MTPSCKWSISIHRFLTIILILCLLLSFSFDWEDISKKTVFDHISKHLKVHKNTLLHVVCIFNYLLRACKCAETWSFVFWCITCTSTSHQLKLHIIPSNNLHTSSVLLSKYQFITVILYNCTYIHLIYIIHSVYTINLLQELNTDLYFIFDIPKSICCSHVCIIRNSDKVQL